MSPQLVQALVLALIQIIEAIHAQRAAQPAGSNPSLDQLAQEVRALITHALTPPPAAG